MKRQQTTPNEWSTLVFRVNTAYAFMDYTDSQHKNLRGGHIRKQKQKETKKGKKWHRLSSFKCHDIDIEPEIQVSYDGRNQRWYNIR